MVCKQAWATLFAINIFAWADGAETISGRVVGGAGPVAGVKVSLVPNGSITATTGTDGLFQLTVPSSGVNPGGGLPDFSIRNNRLELRLAMRQAVSVGFYSTAGRWEREAWHSVLSAGEYAFPLHEATSGLPSGLHLVRITVGSAVSCAKIVVAEGAVRFLGESGAAASGPGTGPALTKRAAGDTLVLAKAGFFGKKVPLPSRAKPQEL